MAGTTPPGFRGNSRVALEVLYLRANTGHISVSLRCTLALRSSSGLQRVLENPAFAFRTSCGLHTLKESVPSAHLFSGVAAGLSPRYPAARTKGLQPRAFSSGAGCV